MKYPVQGIYTFYIHNSIDLLPVCPFLIFHCSPAPYLLKKKASPPIAIQHKCAPIVRMAKTCYLAQLYLGLPQRFSFFHRHR